MHLVVVLVSYQRIQVSKQIRYLSPPIIGCLRLQAINQDSQLHDICIFHVLPSLVGCPEFLFYWQNMNPRCCFVQCISMFLTIISWHVEVWLWYFFLLVVTRHHKTVPEYYQIISYQNILAVKHQSSSSKSSSSSSSPKYFM